MFKRRLSHLQWFSLLLVTVGCMIQKMDISVTQQDSPTPKEAADTTPVGQEEDETLTASVPQRQWHMLTMASGLIFVLIQVSQDTSLGLQ